jgi:hypothetical protein
VLQLYDNESSEASIKGDIAHALLTEALIWGITPNHPDTDIMYGVMLALDYLMKTYKEYGKDCILTTEESLDIPETGEFGTLDVGFVTPALIHVVDYKNGYVPVDIKRNPQLMLYLCGLIAKHGERPQYKISVIQPNYVHYDGMIRHYVVTPEDLATFRGEVALALASQSVIAGKHCRESYCPARGTCAVFLGWAQENLALAYYPGESVAMSDQQLSQALEEADILQGWRDQLRAEAMRRMLHQGKQIAGYKIVKAKKDRNFKDAKAKERVYAELEYLGATIDELHPRTDISVAGVERIVKRIFKPQGQGAWLKGMDYVCPPELLEPANRSLTLEKAIDGRKPYTRGSEFTPLPGTDTLKDIL